MKHSSEAFNELHLTEFLGECECEKQEQEQRALFNMEHSF
jgi:hypothetical protein